jgi:excisionase family DNA binding protein
MPHNPFEAIETKLDIMRREQRELADQLADLKAQIKLDATRISFTLEEAAQATGLSYHTLYNMACDGRMETLQPGGEKGKRLVERDELLRALRENRTKLKVAR